MSPACNVNHIYFNDVIWKTMQECFAHLEWQKHTLLIAQWFKVYHHSQQSNKWTKSTTIQRSTIHCTTPFVLLIQVLFTVIKCHLGMNSNLEVLANFWHPSYMKKVTNPANYRTQDEFEQCMKHSFLRNNIHPFHESLPHVYCTSAHE